MKTKELIKLHERALKTLKGIERAKQAKMTLEANADICASIFPLLKQEYIGHINDIDKDIIRLENLYFDLAVKIQEAQK